MPPFQDKDYIKKIHGAMMSAYGPNGGFSKNNFNLTMDEFVQRMQDKNYASKIHGAMDNAYGANGGYSKGNFNLGFDDFYGRVAKPEGQPAPAQPAAVQQPPAARPAAPTQGSPVAQAKPAPAAAEKPRISFNPDDVRSLETVLKEKANLSSKNDLEAQLQYQMQNPMAGGALHPGGAQSIQPSFKGAPLSKENQQRKLELDAIEKEVSSRVLPKIDELTSSVAGKYRTPDNQIDYERIYADATVFAKNAGGGDYTKEVIAQRMIQKEALHKLKPDIDAFADQEYKKRTGKTITQLLSERDAAAEKASAGALAKKKYVESTFAAIQKQSEEKLTQQASDIFESYKPYLEVLGPEDKEEFDRYVMQYTTAVKGLAAKENARLKRIAKELEVEANSEIEKLASNLNLSPKELKAIDEAYSVGYRRAIEREAETGVQKQRRDLLIGGLPWLAGKSLFEGFNIMLSGWGNGFVGLGMNNRFTDWMRSFQENADRLKTYDAPLSGMNLLDPATYTTRLMRQLGMQAPAMAATFATRNPIVASLVGGTAGAVTEGLQNAGETYERILGETGDPEKAQLATSRYVAEEAKMLPLHFAESSLWFKASKGLMPALKSTVAEVPVELAQEFGQGYAQQAQSENAKSLVRFAKEDYPEIAKETALLTVLQQGAFGGIGQMYKALGEVNRGSGSSYLMDLARKKGLAHASTVLATRFANNMISEEELAVQLDLLGRADADIEAMRDAGISDKQISGYLSTLAEIEDVKKREAALAPDSVIRKRLEEKRVAMEKSLVAFSEGNGIALSVTLPNGSTIAVPAANADQTIKVMAPHIESGDVKVEVLGSGEQADALAKEVKAMAPVVAEPKVSEVVDAPVTMNGVRGRIYQDGQAVVFKEEGVEMERELGNINEIGQRPISELGITQEKSVVGFDEQGNVSVRGKSYVNNYSDPLMAINRDANGDVVSVNLETPDGKKRTFRGAEAEDIAYNIHLKKITENNAERQAFEDFINTDEEARAEVDAGGLQEAAPAVTAEAVEQVQQPEAAAGAAPAVAPAVAKPRRVAAAPKVKVEEKPRRVTTKKITPESNEKKVEEKAKESVSTAAQEPKKQAAKVAAPTVSAAAKPATAKGEAPVQVADDESKIVNPIDAKASEKEKLKQLKKLSNENEPIVKKFLAALDKRLGTSSKTSHKEPEKIVEKASRPSILATKPWHAIEHIRDSFRFKTVIKSLDQIPEIMQAMADAGMEVVKADFAKQFNPKEWGWRFVAFDIRMPNGQLVEYYMPLQQLEAAKKPNHILFEKWRNKDVANLSYEEAMAYARDVAESRERYDNAFQDYLDSVGLSETEALASFNKAIAEASSRTGSKFSAKSSGATTLPSSQAPSEERRATKSTKSETKARPSGDVDANTFIDTKVGESDDKSVIQNPVSLPTTQGSWEVVVAPLYDTQLGDVASVREFSKTAAYKQFVENMKAIAGSLGLKVKEVHLNLGGYTNDSGNKIREASTTLVIEGGDFAAAKKLAALMGSLAPEVQESTIAGRFISEDEFGTDAHTADRHEITVSDIEKATQLLNELGLDYSVDVTGSRLILLDFEKTEGSKFEQLHKKLLSGLKKKKIRYENKIKPIESALITSEGAEGWTESRAGLLEEVRGEAGLFQRRPELRAVVDEAIRRNNEFIEYHKLDKERVEYSKLRAKQISLQERDQDLSPDELSRMKELLAVLTPNVKDIISNRADAYDAAKAEIDAVAEELAKGKGFAAPYNKKKPARASVKTMAWYDGNPDRLGDGARVSIIVSDKQDAVNIFEKLKTRYGKNAIMRMEVGVTDLGFPKMLLEVRTANGRIAEYQVISPEAYMAKIPIEEFPESYQPEARRVLEEIRRTLGYNLPGGVSHWFYELHRDGNVPNRIREEAARLSNMYWQAILHPKKDMGFTARDLAQGIANLQREVEQADKSGWDDGNNPKLNEEGIQFVKDTLRKGQPAIGDVVAISPQIKDGMSRVMEFDGKEWKQNVAGKLYVVGGKVQEEAQQAWNNKYDLNTQARTSSSVHKKVLDDIDRAERALKSTGISFEPIYSVAEFAKRMAELGYAPRENAQGVFVQAEGGKILINMSKIGDGNWDIVWHEGTHPIVNIIRNTNPEQFDQMFRGLVALAKKNRVLAKALEYGKSQGSEWRMKDEAVVEAIAKVAQGDIEFDEMSPGVLQRFIDFMNAIAEFLGFEQLLPNTDATEFKRMAQKISDFLTTGTDVSGLVGEENVGRTAAKEKVQAKAVSIAKGTETLKRFGLKPGRNTARKIAEAFEKRAVEKYGRISAEDRSEDAIKRVSGWMADEVEFWLGLHGDKSGKGWYGEKFQKGLDAMADMFPEMASDQSARDIFTMLVAITSDGTDVMQNFQYASDIYDFYRRNGKMPKTVPHQRVESIEARLKAIQSLLNEYGGDVQAIKKFLLTIDSIKNINDKRRKSGLKPMSTGGWPVEFKAPVAAAVFSAKLGMFYANLSGIENYPTLDRWWSRTFNRYRGLLIPKVSQTNLDEFKKLIGLPDAATNEEAILATTEYRDRLEARGFKTRLAQMVGKSEPSKAAEKKEWLEKARALAGSKFDELYHEHKVERKANTINKQAYTNINDAPFNAGDRMFMYEAFKRTKKRLAARGIDASIADIQAMLWYFEKNLYSALGVSKPIKGISYADAGRANYEKWLASGKTFRYRFKEDELGDVINEKEDADEGVQAREDEISKLPIQEKNTLAVRSGLLLHGGSAKIDKLDVSKASGGVRAIYGNGVYFSDSSHKSADYGSEFTYLDKSKLSIIDTKAPITPEFIKSANALAKKMDEDGDLIKGATYSFFARKLEEQIDGSRSIDMAWKNVRDSLRFDKQNDWQRMLKDMGYDTIKHGYEYVVFDAEKGTAAIVDNVDAYIAEKQNQKLAQFREDDDLEQWVMDNLRAYPDLTVDELMDGLIEDNPDLATDTRKRNRVMKRLEQAMASAEKTISKQDENPADFPVGVGINHAQTALLLDAFGLAPYEKNEQSVRDWDEEAETKLRNGYDVDKLVSRLERNPGISPVETRILAKYIAGLVGVIEKNPTPELIDEMNRVVRAADFAGSFTGRALRARRGLQIVDESLAGFYNRKMESLGVFSATSLSDKQHQEIKTEYQKLVETKNKYKKSYAKAVAAAIKATLEGVQMKDADPVVFVKKGEVERVAGIVKQMVEDLIGKGVLELENVEREAAQLLAGAGVQGISEADVRDVIAGKYDDKKPARTKNQLKEHLFNLKTEANLLEEISKLEKGIVPGNDKVNKEKNIRLANLRHQRNKLRKKYASPLSETEALDRAKSIMRSQIEKVKNQIESGKFKSDKKVEFRLDEEGKQLTKELRELRYQREIAMLRDEYERNATRLKIGGKSINVTKLGDNALKVLNVPRTIMASADMSAPLRQALFATISHPVLAKRAAGMMVDTAKIWNEEQAQDLFDDYFAGLREDPRYQDMMDIGLGISDPNSPYLAAREEVFMDNPVDRIPIAGGALKVKGKVRFGGIVKGSERAYVLYLNKMRVDLYNQFADHLESKGMTPENSKEAYKSMVNLVNDMTGRGSIHPKLEQFAPFLNAIFFSPRLIASRINMLNFFRVASLPTRKLKLEFLKSWALTVGVNSLILYAIASIFGGDDDDEGVSVELDPRSSDFAKIKVGNTRWDIWGGMQPYVRLAAQVITGKTKSGTTGELKDIDYIDRVTKREVDGEKALIERFFRNKLAPVASAAVSSWTGEFATGEEFNWGDQLKQFALPIIFGSTSEGWKEHGPLALAMITLPEFFGISASTYDAFAQGAKDKVIKHKTAPVKRSMTTEEYKRYINVRKVRYTIKENMYIQRGVGVDRFGDVTLDEKKIERRKHWNDLTPAERAMVKERVLRAAGKEAMEYLFPNYE